tara:strand:- start:220 stop:1044 length:825 start_codon:yes stop_codon:yes gene_type:complete
MFIATLIFIFAMILIICMWWGSSIVWLGAHIGLSVNNVSLGDWGDSFSALNTAFSGGALLGLGATVYLQLRFARRQQVDNGKAEFERVYFQLFDLVRELKSELRFASTPRKSLSSAFTSSSIHPHLAGVRVATGDEKVGAEAIKLAYDDVSKQLSRYSSVSHAKSPSIERLYNIVVNRKFQAEFGPYFRVIYSILKRIDVSTVLNETEKLDYSRLLRSQMTSQEVVLLGLNGLQAESKDLKDYLIKYRMLKYSQSGELRKVLHERYPSETFNGR